MKIKNIKSGSKQVEKAKPVKLENQKLLTQIEEDENEIAYLEKKLGIAGDEKKQSK